MRWGGLFVDGAEEWRVVKCGISWHGKSKAPRRPPEEMRWRTRGFREAELDGTPVTLVCLLKLIDA